MGLFLFLFYLIQSGQQSLRVLFPCFIDHLDGGKRHIQQTDGGVRQTAVFHVPLGKTYTFGYGIVADSYLMVVHILFLHGVQHLDGGLYVRLAYLHGFETAAESMVRLNDLAVFVNGGGADDRQVAVRQFGFQYIPRTGISLPVVQQYVDFVNKQDGIVDIPQFFQDIFQAVLNLSFIGGSGNQGGVV